MKIPVTIISGFLGAGKTTFLLPLIAEMKRQSLKPYVIVNELGALDVDGSILTKLYPDVMLQTILNGCLCCNRKADLTPALEQAVIKRPDRIIIETTGIANPVELIDVIYSLPFRGKLFLDQLIGVIDATIVMSNEPMLLTPCLDSIRAADHILINKIDRVPVEYHAELVKKVTSANPTHVHLTHQSRVESGLITEWLAKPQKTGESKAVTGEKIIHTTSHSKLNSAYLSIPVHPFLNAIKVEGWLKKFALSLKKNPIMPGRILRAKGYIRLSAEEQFYLYQYANGYHEWQLVDHPPGKEPYMVLIGQELDEKELQNDFNDHFPAW